MNGWKTVLTGALLATVPSLTSYFELVDWSFLGETGGMVASGVVMIALRLVTSTPAFRGK